MEETTLRLSLKLYAQEAIVATIYKYSGEYTIFQELAEDDVLLTIKLKDNSKVIPTDLLDRFQTDLIDQQVRYNVSKEFGHIRNLIVEEAFKPINKR